MFFFIINYGFINFHWKIQMKHFTVELISSIKEENGVTIFGSSNIDYVYILEKFPQEGKTTKSKRFFKNPGGKSSNQAVMIAKLQKKSNIIFVACLGNDHDGQNIHKNLSKMKFLNPEKHIRLIDGINTSVAHCMVEENGHNRIIVTPGANDLLSIKHFEESLDDVKKNTKIYVTGLEVNYKIVTETLIQCKKNGLYTILNPSPARKDLPQEMFENTDLICLNESEVEIITGLNIEKDFELTKKAAKLLQEKGIKEIVITLGSKGCTYLSENGEFSHYEAEKVKPKDTTGAGDCFLGSLAYFISCNIPIPQGIKASQYIASLAIQKEGAQNKYPNREELIE